jgi:long-chain acyl-CoA synthetase
MDYLTTDKPNPRGEIWLRGPSVFAGYYKNASVTSESITEDGWFKTGDVGLWRSDGNLQIIDRKKSNH